MNDATGWVFIVDDDASVRKALSRLLCAAGYFVETFSTSAEFLAFARPAAPACLVLDVCMPASDGLHLQRELIAGEACLPIVFISAFGNIPMSVQALKLGAIDFLQKPVDKVELIRAVREAIDKDTCDRAARAKLSVLEQRLASLSPREREVLEYVVAGYLNKQIAGRLGITEKTIKVHRGSLMRRMQARSLAELVHMAERLAIVGPMHVSSPPPASPASSSPHLLERS